MSIRTFSNDKRKVFVGCFLDSEFLNMWVRSITPVNRPTVNGTHCTWSLFRTERRVYYFGRRNGSSEKFGNSKS